MGRANEIQAQYIYAPSNRRVAYYAGYAQDDYKVTKKLTLGLGVRWDLFMPDFQKYYHKGWIDPSIPNPGLTSNIQGTFIGASPSDPTGVNQDGSNGAYATEPVVNSPGYGALGGQANYPRQIQFGLRLNW